MSEAAASLGVLPTALSAARLRVPERVAALGVSLRDLLDRSRRPDAAVPNF